MQRKTPNRLFADYKNSVICKSTSCSPFYVLLSDQSSAFGVGCQGNILTPNGVEIFINDKDVLTPFGVKQLKLNEPLVYIEGRSI